MKVLTIIISLFMFASCANKSEQSLCGVRWNLDEIKGEKVALKQLDDTMFIKFDNKEMRVSGKAACNRFFGDYELDGGSLKFLPMGATRMACPDLSVEQEFFKILDQVNGYEIKDNKLELKRGDETVLEFTLASSDE